MARTKIVPNRPAFKSRYTELMDEDNIYTPPRPTAKMPQATTMVTYATRSSFSINTNNSKTVRADRDSSLLYLHYRSTVNAICCAISDVETNNSFFLRKSTTSSESLCRTQVHVWQHAIAFVQSVYHLKHNLELDDCVDIVRRNVRRKLYLARRKLQRQLGEKGLPGLRGYPEMEPCILSRNVHQFLNLLPRRVKIEKPYPCLSLDGTESLLYFTYKRIMEQASGIKNRPKERSLSTCWAAELRRLLYNTQSYKYEKALTLETLTEKGAKLLLLLSGDSL